MRVLRTLQVTTALSAVVMLGACSSTGGYHHPDDGVSVSATWDSGPLDRDYQSQLSAMQTRHNNEIAHPAAGESSDQMAQRHAAEDQDLSKRYAQGEASHAKSMPPGQGGQ
jgi:hypothetical protein